MAIKRKAHPVYVQGANCDWLPAIGVQGVPGPSGASVYDANLDYLKDQLVIDPNDVIYVALQDVPIGSPLAAPFWRRLVTTNIPNPTANAQLLISNPALQWLPSDELSFGNY